MVAGRGDTGHNRIGMLWVCTHHDQEYTAVFEDREDAEQHLITDHDLGFEGAMLEFGNYFRRQRYTRSSSTAGRRFKGER